MPVPKIVTSILYYISYEVTSIKIFKWDISKMGFCYFIKFKNRILFVINCNVEEYGQTWWELCTIRVYQFWSTYQLNAMLSFFPYGKCKSCHFDLNGNQQKVLKLHLQPKKSSVSIETIWKVETWPTSKTSPASQLLNLRTKWKYTKRYVNHIDAHMSLSTCPIPYANCSLNGILRYTSVYSLFNKYWELDSIVYWISNGND